MFFSVDDDIGKILCMSCVPSVSNNNITSIALKYSEARSSEAQQNKIINHIQEPRTYRGHNQFKEEMKLNLAHLCMCYYYLSIHNNREIYVQSA